MINQNFQKLPGSYLFSEIARRVRTFQDQHPDRKIIRLGIGDVTRPLAPIAIDALHQASDDLSRAESFHGYGPEQGYAFLREAIVAAQYAARGIAVHADEIFVSDGAKSDVGNIGDLFDAQTRVAICDPVYPVYVDSNVMDGRAGFLQADGRWSDILYLPCTEENGFCPEVPSEDAPVPDLIYLCFPNNPTGAMATREQLAAFVDYANRHQAIILYDAAYEAFITGDFPHSIFEIPGARTCAIEFNSFSKLAGFTGVRCGYTVVPKELEREGASLHALWNRRQSTRFNGASYLTQRAAEAVLSPEGQAQIRETIRYYQENARVIRDGLLASGFTVFGGVHAPYIWLKTPDGLSSWAFFDALLDRAGVVGTPGSGFGPHGEGYFRLTAFGSHEVTHEAMQRIADAWR